MLAEGVANILFSTGNSCWLPSSYSSGGQTCSSEKSLAENQKHQWAAKWICSVKYSSL